MLPNLIIPGAQKSGTTSLYAFLQAHPDIGFAHPKEPSFFSRHAQAADMNLYARYFSRNRGRNRKIIADGSTSYMADPAVPGLLRQQLGENLKFIFIMRSPLERAYSAYLHLAKRGHETRSPDKIFGSLGASAADAVGTEATKLADAIRDELVVLKPYMHRYDDASWAFRYINNGCYSTAVERFERIFGRENVLPIIFEDFVRETTVVREAIAAFLGVAASGFPTAVPRRNSTELPGRTGWIGSVKVWIRSTYQGRRDVLRRVDTSAIPDRLPEHLAKEMAAIFLQEAIYWSTRLDKPQLMEQWL